MEEVKSKRIAIDEILRQRELRILKHRREWHCDPHNISESNKKRKSSFSAKNGSKP